MDQRFATIVEVLEEKRQRLLSMSPFAWCRPRPKQLPERGIYLFSESGEHRYVGRSNNLRSRLGGHCRPSSKPWTAALAFRLAREATGQLRATYKKDGSRVDLMGRPTFHKAFDEAKTRIGQMEIRVVEEIDPTRQALLEIYCAVTLEARYNDFDNH